MRARFINESYEDSIIIKGIAEDIIHILAKKIVEDYKDNHLFWENLHNELKKGENLQLDIELDNKKHKMPYFGEKIPMIIALSNLLTNYHSIKTDDGNMVGSIIINTTELSKDLKDARERKKDPYDAIVKNFGWRKKIFYHELQHWLDDVKSGYKLMDLAKKDEEGFYHKKLDKNIHHYNDEEEIRNLSSKKNIRKRSDIIRRNFYNQATKNDDGKYKIKRKISGGGSSIEYLEDTLYNNDPHEISAQFTEFILNEDNLDLPLNELIKKLKSEFSFELNILPEKDQRALLRRASQYWHKHHGKM